MGVVKQKCSNCGARLDLYAENILLYCPCCAHELHPQKKEEPENVSEIIEAGIHSAQAERWMGEIRERYGLTDDSNNDDPLSGTNTENKEITCPNCHTKLILKTSKELRYCPCCAQEFPVEEKPALKIPEQITPIQPATENREPVAVYSVTKRKKNGQKEETYFDKIFKIIGPFLILLLYPASLILLLAAYGGADEFTSRVFIIILCVALLVLIADWIRKFITYLHDRSIDRNS